MRPRRTRSRGQPLLARPALINFIFSEMETEAQLTQWAFLYSRLPYLLCYARLLVEHVYSTFEKRTAPGYLEDMERRIAAGSLLAGETIEESYRSEPIETFLKQTLDRLTRSCRAQGARDPERGDLEKMRDAGALPDERWYVTKRRALEYSLSETTGRALRRLRRWMIEREQK
jgi:hypothetical protein